MCWRAVRARSQWADNNVGKSHFWPMNNRNRKIWEVVIIIAVKCFGWIEELCALLSPFRAASINKQEKNVFSSTRKNFAALSLHVRLIDASLWSSKNDLPQGINETMWKLFNWLARVRCTAMVFNLMLCCLLSFSNFRYQQRRLQHRECRCLMSLSRGRMRKFYYFMESYNYHLVCRVMIHRIVARKSYCSKYVR